MEKQKCPEVRFKGFQQPWHTIRLGDVTNCYSGGTPSIGIKSFYGGDIPFIRSGEINSNRTELYLTEEGLAKSSAKLVKEGNLLYALYGATSGEVSLSLINGAINQAILAIIPKDSIESIFLSSWFRKSKGKILTNYLQGGQGNLSGEIVKNLIVDIPSASEEIEQIKIGTFFQNLDQSLALHEKKLIQTQNFKKAMLEKMFPKQGSLCPEIRLKGFSGDWKRFKLGDIASIVDRKDSASTAPIMMISAASGFINQSEKYSSNNAGQSLAKYTVLQKGELAYNHGASKHKPYGACFALEVDEARIPFVYHCFNVGENNPYFTAIALNHFRIDGQLRKLISSGARMDGLLNISFNAYKTVEVMLPNKEEQDEIHNFFKSLDETLTLQQQKLRTLKNLKQALLEKMFV